MYREKWEEDQTWHCKNRNRCFFDDANGDFDLFGLGNVERTETQSTRSFLVQARQTSKCMSKRTTTMTRINAATNRIENVNAPTRHNVFEFVVIYLQNTRLCLPVQWDHCRSIKLRWRDASKWTYCSSESGRDRDVGICCVRKKSCNCCIEFIRDLRQRKSRRTVSWYSSREILENNFAVYIFASPTASKPMVLARSANQLTKADCDDINNSNNNPNRYIMLM